MYYRRAFRRKPRYTYTNSDSISTTDVPKPRAKKHSGGIAAMFFLVILLLFAAAAASFLKDLSSQIAVSDASDIVTAGVNRAISDIMLKGDYTGDYFVTFEKNDTGEVTAISSNMARINALSAQILDRVVGETDNRNIIVKIPAGNLTGISLLMGKGPEVPVEIIALTSSRVEFNNSIVTAGINQTKHQLNLEVIVDVDILIPWSTVSTEVITDVLIADTVIVGQVPDTYLNVQ